MNLVKVIFLVLLATSCVNAQKIEWLKSYKEASKIARETGKPMLLDFTASWCKPCLEMDKSFWTRPDIIDLASTFVCVKVDFDSDKGLASKYGVVAIPNVTTTDPWGNGLNFSRGFGNNADQIITRLKFVPKDFLPISEAFQQIEVDKNNITALTKIADFYEQSKFLYQSNVYRKKLLKLETMQPKREELLLKIGLDYLRVGAPEDAEDCFKDFQKDFPQSAGNEIALFGLIYVNLQKKKLGNAEKTIEKLRSAYPGSQYLAKAETDLNDLKQKKN